MSSENGEHYIPPTHMNTGPALVLPDGFPFTADSPIRRYTEPAGIMLLPYIAGLTIMDDRVAAGVSHHSAFKSKPVRRGIGTARSALTLVFGAERQAGAEAERIIQFHNDVVHGNEDGIGYHANDQELQTWVLACVFNGIETASHNYSRRGDDYDREGLWQDVRTFGVFFGIDPDLLPADCAAVDTYWAQRLTDGSLLRTPTSHQTVQDVFRFEFERQRQLKHPLARVIQAVSVTALDPLLLMQAGLEPNKTDLRIAKTVNNVVRHTYGRLSDEHREAVIPTYLKGNALLNRIVHRDDASEELPATA